MTSALVLLVPAGAATGSAVRQADAGPGGDHESSSAARRTCSTGGRTVARNTSARFWLRGPRYVGRYYGCAFTVGRSFLLNPRDGMLGDPVALAGERVAFMRGDADNLHWRVVVRNLRTGKATHSARAHQADQGGDENGGPATKIVVRPSGAVAWLACESIAKDDDYCTSQEVHAIGTDHRPRVFDVAPIRSLTLSGATIRWTRATGEVRTAPLK